MRKKFLAALLATSLVFTIAPVIPAGTAVTAAAETAETAVTELNCVEFLDAQTDGYEVTESGIEITFKSTSASSAKDNWETPALIAYTADEPKFKGANYKEYAIIRSDAFAWKDGVFDNNKDSDDWKNSGYTFDAKFPEDWAAWVEANKAGTDCKVQAIKKDGKVYVEVTNGNLTSVTSFPITGNEKIYLSLTGENCKLTDIKTANYTGINDIISEPSAPSEPSTPSDPGNNGDDEPELSTMKIKSVVAKANKKQVTGKLSVSGAKVKVKVGSAKYKAAKVNGKKFTFKTSKLKKGTKIKIKATKSGYETVTKSVKVK